MSADYLTTKKADWARASLLVPTVVQALENELQRMTDRGVNQAVLDAKSHQIDCIVRFYNATEEAITDLSAYVRRETVLRRSYQLLLERLADEQDPDRFIKTLEHIETDLGLEVIGVDKVKINK